MIRFLFLLLLVSCNSKPTVTTFSGTTMEMHYLIHVGQSLTTQEKIEVEALIHNTFQETKEIFSLYVDDSELLRLNALTSQKPIPISKPMQEVLILSDHINNLSEGRFDPTVYSLSKLWKASLENGKIPLVPAISSIGWEKIHLEKDTFTKDDPATELDLGGIAKGYCLDQIALRLNEVGYPNLFVSWGGEIVATGKHPEGRSWSAYITRLNDTDPEHAIAYVDLQNEALATSGDYLQVWEVNGKAYTHILNPKTGTPLEIQPGRIASVTVSAPTCALADGIATAAMMFENAKELQLWAEALQESYPKLKMWIVTRED